MRLPVCCEVCVYVGSASLLSSCVLVLGNAQDISVFDPVNVLQLQSAGWHCVVDPAH